MTLEERDAVTSREHRFFLCVSILLRGIGVLSVAFVRNFIQAFVDALAPSSELHLKTVNAELVRRREESIREQLEANMAKIKDMAGEALPDAAKEQLREALRRTPLGLSRKRSWVCNLEVTGTAGTTQTAQVMPQCLFHVNKLIAVDDAEQVGSATEIVGVFVGNRVVTTAFGASIPTDEFLGHKRNNELPFPTCEAALFITLQIRFVRDAVFNASLFGEAVM